MEQEQYIGKTVLFFDGVCNLCNGAVSFIIRHERKETLFFSALQSASGRQLQRKYLETQGRPLPDSLVFYDHGQYYLKSDAVFQIAQYLGGWFRLVLIFRILPRRLCNRLYDYIAGRRYRWWGRQKACMTPSANLKERFF